MDYQIKEDNNQFGYYYQPYVCQTPNGEAYNPVMYNYDNVNFNPYLEKQMAMEADPASDDSESEGSVDENKVKLKKKKNKYRAKSHLKDYTCGLIWHILCDLIFLSLLGGLVFMIMQGSDDVTIVGVVLVTFICIRNCIIYCYDTMPWLLNNILNDKGANEYIDMIRQKRPKPRYGMECYHYETHYDSKGHRSRRKVTTWTGYRQFNYQYWADWSPEIYKALGKHKLSAIVISKKLIFFDRKTEKHYNKMYAKFIRKNKNRDRHYNIFENLHVDNFQQYTLACRKSKDLPFYFNTCMFWFCACTCLSGLYCLFWSQVASIDYKLCKVISNKEKIQMGEDDGGDGKLSSCTASDSTAGDIGLGFQANDQEDQDMQGNEDGDDGSGSDKKKKKKSDNSDSGKKKKKKSENSDSGKKKKKKKKNSS